ncbi:MAG: 2-oxo acid dehydrogenase subunit E2, partial [Actinobacteria bacterium]|nr:2-oxo acid dehydrogenase subunit E2 [Actinomycetota bacterium]NIS31064.1 2-oxo acid dehydrogenase subunit E2 [Actinomycetota bacterium]NIW28042.1 2-oxo acid dehydrogenase subunit E2 [Actinomycetota bacterium]
PSVRKLARELGVDLGAVNGSGEAGRITHQDVQQAASKGSSSESEESKESKESGSRPEAPPPAPAPRKRSAQQGAGFEVPSGAFRVPPYRPSDNDEVVPFSRRRRIIADHMVYSKHTAPDVVTFAECDLYQTAQLRDAHKG